MNKFNAPASNPNAANKFAQTGARAPVSSRQSAPTRAPTPAGTMPTHLLKIKTPEGSFKTLTGLFTKEGKGGAFLQGNDRESGLSYYAMPAREGDGYKLRIRDVSDSGESSFRDVAELSLKSKDGNDFLTGDGDGTTYYIWRKDEIK